MATQAAETLQRSVRALAVGRGAENASDQELLDRFVHQHDEVGEFASGSGERGRCLRVALFRSGKHSGKNGCRVNALDISLC